MRQFGSVAAMALLVAVSGCAERSSPLIIATTTSVGHSGLLDVLTAAFDRETGVTVRAHLVGSGQALRMLERGNVGLAITHAPAREAEYVGRHPEWTYRKIMFNDFVIAGPPGDPAAVRQARTASDAMARIAREGGSRFVSRGDNSGTHERETALWQACGARPPGDRLIVASQGMSGTLRVAAEVGAYTLTDRATMSQLAASVPGVRVLFEGDPSLMNTYAVITPGRPTRAARGFSEWLADGGGRRGIETFRVRGHAAFNVWPQGAARTHPYDLPR